MAADWADLADPVVGTVAPATPAGPIDWSVIGDPVVGKVEVSPTPAASGGFNQRAGSLATGANDALARLAAAPVDTATGIANDLGRMRGTLNAALSPGMQKYTSEAAAPIVAPVGGSDSTKKLMTASVGRTEPQDETDRLLYATGSGIGSTVGGMGLGATLNAAGVAPRLAQILGGTPESFAPVRNIVAGGSSGAGSEFGRNAVAGYTDNPLAQTIGALAGGIGGGALGATVASAPGVIARSVKSAVAPFTEGGKREIAGRVLNESTTPGNAPDLTAEPPLPALRPTAGELSNDPGLLKLQRALEQRNPSLGASFAGQAGENNQAIRSALEGVGTPGSPADLSQQMARGLDALRGAGRAGERAAWADVPMNTPVPTQPLKDAFNEFAAGLSKVRQKFIPTDYRDTLLSYGEHEPMSELADLRSSLLADIRGARSQGDFNRANVLSGLEDKLFSPMRTVGEQGAVTTPEQAATLTYQNATAASREYNQLFNKGNIRKVFALDASGADRVPDSAVADVMLGPGRGQAERVQQFVSAAGQDPQVVQAARDWVATKLHGQIASSKQDPSGDPFVLNKKLSNFIANNEPLIKSPLFTAEQRDALNRAAEATAMVGRTGQAGAPGGSDTAAKLGANKFIDAFVDPTGNSLVSAVSGKSLGNLLNPAVGGTVGAGIGGSIGSIFGPLGATAGASVGAPLGMNLAGKLQAHYHGSADQIANLVASALRNPTLARELMFEASPTNAANVPTIRNYLATLPLTAASPQNRAAR